MRTRIKLMILLSLFVIGKNYAQVTHTFIYNGTVFANFYNKELDRIEWPYNVIRPSLIYEIQKNRFVVKIFNQYYLNGYHNTQIGLPDSSIIGARNSTLGLALAYNLVRKKSILI